MSLILRDPFKELEQIQQKMAEAFQLKEGDATGGIMPVNIYEKNNNLVVEAIVPNFRPDEVEVNVTKDRIEIKAERSEDTEEKEKKYYRRESRHESLYRQIGLPKGVDVDGAKATRKDGVVTIQMPFSQSVEPKRLEIEEPEG